MDTPLATRASKAGDEWASQFAAGDSEKIEGARAVIASSFSTGWMIGYQAGVEDCAKIVENVR